MRRRLVRWLLRFRYVFRELVHGSPRRAWYTLRFIRLMERLPRELVLVVTLLVWLTERLPHERILALVGAVEDQNERTVIRPVTVA